MWPRRGPSPRSGPTARAGVRARPPTGSGGRAPGPLRAPASPPRAPPAVREGRTSLRGAPLGRGDEAIRSWRHLDQTGEEDVVPTRHLRAESQQAFAGAREVVVHARRGLDPELLARLHVHDVDRVPLHLVVAG